MISAGFKIDQCGSNTACQQTFQRVETQCASMGADADSCRVNHIENVPNSYFAQDEVWKGANISAADHKLMLEAHTSKTWNGQALGGAAPAQPAAPVAQQPVTQPAQQPPPPAPVNESRYPTNRYLMAGGAIGFPLGSELEFKQRLPGQKNQEFNAVSGGFHLRGGFPIHPRFFLGAYAAYNVLDLKDLTVGDSLIDEQMGVMHQFHVGVSAMGAAHENVMVGADIFYSRGWADRVYRGIEGVCTSSDGVSCDQDSKYTGNGIGFGLNLAWMPVNTDSVSFGPYANFTGIRYYGNKTDTVAGQNSSDPFISQLMLGIELTFIGRKQGGDTSAAQPAANANVSATTNP